MLFTGVATAPPWLGAKRIAAYTFVWEDEIGNQISFSYENWSPNEPNGKYGKHDCVTMRMDTGSWNDVPCYVLHFAICEHL